MPSVAHRRPRRYGVPSTRRSREGARTISELIDQELVVHAYAPTDGPLASQAYQQISAIWSRSRELLGLTGPIATTSLPTALPTDLAAYSGECALAAQEHPTGDFQMIVRRVHDVLNLSIAFAAPLDPPGRQRRTGSALPPGWVEFDRWWDELAAEGTDALLGTVRLYQAKFPGSAPLDAAAAVRAALPAAPARPDRPQRGEVRLGEFAVWEWSPGHDPDAERRIAVIGGAGRDPQLSAWTWSRGDVVIPPFARYLLHAAKIRYQARVWDGGRAADLLRRRLDDGVSYLESLLAQPADGAERAGARHRLQVDEAALATITARMGEMRRTVEVGLENMTRALSEPLRSDVTLARWLIQQIDDMREYLDLAGQRAARISEIAARDRPVRATADAPGGQAIRMGFGLDIVGYSQRSSPLKEDAQRRLAELVRAALADVDVAPDETDHQGTGDGMNVFLPQRVEVHRVLPRLLTSCRERLAADNQRFRDRLRVRMAVGVGPVGLAALGFGGRTVVEVSRLVDSDVLREAAAGHPDADLVILVSDQLYQWVFGEGYAGPDATRFARVSASAKDFSATAWLWVAR
jgi:CASPASE and TPR Repeat-associated protein